MTRNQSAGLLMCRMSHRNLQFFLVHPGGPYFRNRDQGSWTIPKGMPAENEDLLTAAIREFTEETGLTPTPPFFDVGSIKQKSGKLVSAWAFEGDWDPASGIHCNDFTLEWPPRSGKKMSFPEVDRAAWMIYEKARMYIIAEQIPFLDRATLIFVK